MFNKNKDLNSIGNLIYEDDDWFVFSYPTAGAHHVFSANDNTDPILRLNLPPTLHDSVFSSFIHSHRNPKPINEGDIELAATALEILGDNATEEQRAKLSEADRIDRLTKNSEIGQNSLTFNISPQGDTSYRAGVGTNCNQGLGIALEFRAKLKDNNSLNTLDIDESNIRLLAGDDEAKFNNFKRPNSVFRTTENSDGDKIARYYNDPLLVFDSNDNFIYKKHIYHNNHGAPDAPSTSFENTTYFMFLYYDYDDEHFKTWHNDKDVVSTAPHNHQGYSPTTQSLVVKNTFVKNKVTGNSNPMDSFDNRMIDYFFDYDNHTYRYWRADRDMLPYPLFSNERRDFSHSGAVGPNPKVGPEYSLILGPNPVVESKKDLLAIDSSDDSRVFYGNKNNDRINVDEIDWANSTDAGYTSDVLYTHPTNLRAVAASEKYNRSIVVSDSDILVSESVSTQSGALKKSDILDFAFKSSVSVPFTEREAARSGVPIGYLHPNLPSATQISLRPKSVNLIERINSFNIFDGDIFLGTDNSVYRVSMAELIGVAEPNVINVLSTGSTIDIVSESTSHFTAKDNVLRSFKYFEQAKGYIGEDENKNLKMSNIGKILLFVQNHNIAIVQQNGSNQLFILSLGQNRLTNGFSRWDFDDIITSVEKINDDKFIVFSANQIARIVDLSKNGLGDQIVDFRDDVVDISSIITGNPTVTKQNYLSKWSSLPIIIINDAHLTAFDNIRISHAAIGLAGGNSSFVLSIGNGIRDVDNDVRVTGENLNSQHSNLPHIVRPVKSNSFTFPIISIRTDSDKQLAISSIITGEQVGSRG